MPMPTLFLATLALCQLLHSACGNTHWLQAAVLYLMRHVLCAQEFESWETMFTNVTGLCDA